MYKKVETQNTYLKNSASKMSAEHSQAAPATPQASPRSSGWPQAGRDSPASASAVLGLQVCSVTLGTCVNLLKYIMQHLHSNIKRAMKHWL